MRVLIVCTANQCRSPMAEFLLRQRADTLGVDWTITSAGTHAAEGLPMHRNTAKLLQQRQISVPTDWRTHAIDAELLAASDLILAATRDQRSLIVERQPHTLGRAFTILQFARYTERTRAVGLWQPQQESLPSLDVLDRTEPADNLADDDLADPVGRWYRPFKICAATLDDAVARMLGDSGARPTTTADLPPV